VGTASPEPAAPLPTVKIVAPGKGQVLAANKAGDTEVKLDVKNWKTATGSQHVHLILDNKPYKAIYDTKAPVKLSELTGGEPLTEGTHVLVAFPSRANHESVKGGAGVLPVVEFAVDKKGEPFDAKKPMLIYSRPKGEYKGEMANHVLVDFQLAGTTLGEGKGAVTIEVTGPGVDKPLTAKAEKFGPPFYLENLRSGAYTLKLELLGPDGKVVPGAWNSTTREIKINREAPADPTPHGGHEAPKAEAPAAAPAKGDAVTKAGAPAKGDARPAKK
jgi:hypothetical protein